MDEAVGVLIAVLVLVARFVIYVIVDLVFETVVRGAITGLLWLVWPGGRKAPANDEVERRRP